MKTTPNQAPFAESKRVYISPRASLYEASVPSPLCTSPIGGSLDDYIEKPIDWSAQSPSIDWIL